MPNTTEIKVKPLAPEILATTGTKKYEPTKEVLTALSRMAERTITRNRFYRIAGFRDEIPDDITVKEYYALAHHYGLEAKIIYTLPEDEIAPEVKSKVNKFQ
jgi:hypothetical protein